MIEKKETANNPLEGIELNAFKQIEKGNYKLSLILRWVIFGLILAVLTILVNNNTSVIESLTNEEIPVELQQALNDTSVSNFMSVIQGTISFFMPLVWILLTTLVLKMVATIFRGIFQRKILMKELLITSTLAYTSLFISNVIRHLFSLISGEYVIHSLGSLGFYFPELLESSLVFKAIGVLDLFVIGYCFLLALGLWSFSQIKLYQSMILMSLFLIIQLGFSVFLV